MPLSRVPLRQHVEELYAAPFGVAVAPESLGLLPKLLLLGLDLGPLQDERLFVVLAQLEQSADAVQLRVQSADGVLVQRLRPARLLDGFPQPIANRLVEFAGGQAVLQLFADAILDRLDAEELRGGAHGLWIDGGPVPARVVACVVQVFVAALLGYLAVHPKWCQGVVMAGPRVAGAALVARPHVGARLPRRLIHQRRMPALDQLTIDHDLAPIGRDPFRFPGIVITAE